MTHPDTEGAQKEESGAPGGRPQSSREGTRSAINLDALLVEYGQAMH